MAQFETLFAPFVPPEVDTAKILEWNNCSLKHIPINLEHESHDYEALNVRFLRGDFFKKNYFCYTCTIFLYFALGARKQLLVRAYSAEMPDKSSVFGHVPQQFLDCAGRNFWPA